MLHIYMLYNHTHTYYILDRHLQCDFHNATTLMYSGEQFPMETSWSRDFDIYIYISIPNYGTGTILDKLK